MPVTSKAKLTKVVFPPAQLCSRNNLADTPPAGVFTASTKIERRDTLKLARTVVTGSPDNEGRRLLAEYETVSRLYSWAVGQLARQVETMPYDECKKLLKMVEDALVGREEARLALERFKKANSQ